MQHVSFLPIVCAKPQDYVVLTSGWLEYGQAAC